MRIGIDRELKNCIDCVNIINGNPIDKRLLKQELKVKYNESTIRLAKLILRDGISERVKELLSKRVKEEK